MGDFPVAEAGHLVEEDRVLTLRDEGQDHLPHGRVVVVERNVRPLRLLADLDRGGDLAA